jgi:hypothetical protein
MQSNIDLSWVQTGRELEVECIDGGRSTSEFTFAPLDLDPDNEEEQTVNERPVDDADKTEERARTIQRYVPYAQKAYLERGLVYPFRVSDSGESLTVLPGSGMREMAKKTAHLGRIISRTGTPSKEFESRGFNALYSFLGGIGTCVGAKRERIAGPEKAVREFRKSLFEHERGGIVEAKYPKNGDLGADGFIILGRPWIGPLIFYQSKNTPFDFRTFPPEFSRVPAIVASWFGRRIHQQRPIISAYASNTLLTIAAREEIFTKQGSAAVMIIDAADILRAEMNQPVAACCTML